MITQLEVKRLFDYDDGCLVRLITTSSRSVKGARIGLMKGSRSEVRIDGGRYHVARVIFVWHHGYMPEVVDHIDGNPFNNLIENLRGCTMGENLYNMRLSGHNKSGIKGVFWDKERQKWIAQIRFNGITHRVGRYSTIDEATIVVRKEREKLHGQFACHGDRNSKTPSPE